MYARWVPPCLSSSMPARPTQPPAEKNDCGYQNQTHREGRQQRKYDNYEEGYKEEEEIETKGKREVVSAEGEEVDSEVKPLSATNGFGYKRWTPGGTVTIGEEVRVKNGIIKKRIVSESESESSESSESPKEEKESSSEDENSEEEEEDQKEGSKRKRVKGDDEKKKVKKAKVEMEENSEGNNSSSSSNSESEDSSDEFSDSNSNNDNISDKQSPESSQEATPNSNPDAMDIDTNEPTQAVRQPAEPSDPIPKPPKREKKKKTSVAFTKQEDKLETPNKHSAILARKEKSLQLTSTLPTELTTLALPVETMDSSDVHGLQPLPQPVIEDDKKDVSFETLPPWLAEPIRVPTDKKASWVELGLTKMHAKALAKKGFPEAFAVQTSVIPLLTPSARRTEGDLLVAAATGSGKTMAYAVPVVRDISRGIVTRLRAIIVLPTRELVRQAAKAFEVCAGVFDNGEGKRVRVGVAVGHQTLRYEQSVLFERTEKFGGGGGDEEGDVLVNKEEERLRGGRGVDINWKVDVLVCTPGRLVEHLHVTPGFDISYMRWLIVDEADKLLGQTFQGWLSELSARLAATSEAFSRRDHPGGSFSGVRKVILSATLTRDLGILAGLRLQRPALVVLEGGGEKEGGWGLRNVLPAGLREKVVRVRETGLKPLVLVEVLRMIAGEFVEERKKERAKRRRKKVAERESSSESNSDSESESDSDSPNSDSDSIFKPTSKPLRSPLTPKTFPPTLLIFTKSNESALRLTALLHLLLPPLRSLTTTLTSATPTAHRHRLLTSLSTRTTRLLVASDLVARGIDVPTLDGVINYDLPASLEGYVHRVGRTARAGRLGVAWTLLPDGESGWFWGKVVKGREVERANEVERIRVGVGKGEFPKEDVQRYEEALAELGRIARGGGQ